MLPNIKILNKNILNIEVGDIGDYANCLLCDPPYGIAIMNETWDSQVALKAETWSHLSSLLLPGAMTIAYSGNRTMFRMGSAMEEADFVMHGMIGWLHLRGFNSPARVRDAVEWMDYRYGADSLRPVLEPVIVAQKNWQTKSQSENILEYHTGIYNIQESKNNRNKNPTNVVVSHHPDCNDTCSEHCPTQTGSKNLSDYVSCFDWHYNQFETLFYQKKPDLWEKEAGLADFESKVMRRVNSGGFSKDKKFENKRRKNTHRTVKPISGAKYLARLFKPPSNKKNLLLVPFCGTGSEIIGAMLAGWENIVGIEINTHYAAIAQARVSFWLDKIAKGHTSVEGVKAGIEKLKAETPQVALF